MLIAIANGCFFNMGARLARYTQNATYLDWTIRTWDWLIELKYIDDKWNVYDGADISNNCTQVSPLQFSYNAGILLQGAAYLWNYVSLVVIHQSPTIQQWATLNISCQLPSISPPFTRLRKN